MEEEELLECAEKDLERSFHNYQCGCQTKEGFLEFLSQAYFRGMGEINKKFGGTERSSPEYKETVRKLRDLFCCNEEKNNLQNEKHINDGIIQLLYSIVVMVLAIF